MEERWKTIDLANFRIVPVDQLEAGKLYIMYGNSDIYPRSRWKIRFNRRNSDRIVADVIDVQLDAPNYNKHFYTGNDKLLGTDPFVFYEYNELQVMKPELLNEITNRHSVPSLAELAQNTMRYTDEVEAAKDYSVFGIRRGIGGFSKKKKTRRRKPTKKYKKKTTSRR